MSCNSVPNDEPQPGDPPKPHRDRVRLRFAKQGIPIPEFLNLDDALDLVGARRFPASWGMSLLWKAMPFRYEKKKKTYFTYRLVGSPIKFYTLRKSPILLKAREAECRQAHQEFRAVMKELQTALLARQIKARKVTVAGEIKPLDPAVFSTQARSIFYSGAIHEREGNLDRKSRVVLREKDFIIWLEHASEGLLGVAGHSLKGTLITRLIRTINDRTQRPESEYRLVKSAGFVLLRDALNEAGRRLSKSEYNRRIWPDIKGTEAPRPGAPSKLDQERFRADQPLLRAELLAILSSEAT